MSTAATRPLPWKIPRSGILPLIGVLALSYSVWHVTTRHPTFPDLQPVVTPSRAPYNTTIAGAGVIEPQSENILVAAIVPGVVVEVAVKVGQQVEAGQLLFRMDDRARRAELRVQQALLQKARTELVRMKSMPRAEDLPPAQARLERFQADYQLQEDQLQRTEGLYTRKVVGEQELVERRQAMAAAKAAMIEAESELAKLKAGAWSEDLLVQEAEIERTMGLVAQAETELDRLQVKAPISGVILKVNVRPGEYVGTPPDKTLMVLGDLSVMHVRVDIDEQDLPRYIPGKPARGYVRGDAQHPVDLQFVRVEPYVEPKQSLTGAGNERVDTRVLQVIYAINADSPTAGQVYVGQQIDVYLQAELPPAESALSRGFNETEPAGPATTSEPATTPAP